MEVHPTTASPTQLRVDMMRGPRLVIVLFFLMLVAFVAIAITWANFAELDEVTSGIGQVIPSGEIQVIQNLEGGIISEILVAEGDFVEAGEVLIRIDDTAAGASFRETEETYFGAQVSVIRLSAEADRKELVFPEKLVRDRPELVARERQLYDTRQAELRSSLAILAQQRSQRSREREELQSRLKSLRRSFALSKEEFDITAPLAESGIVSKVEVLRLEREVNDLQSEIDSTVIAIPRAGSAIAEADQRIQERQDAFRAEALRDRNERQVRMAALLEGMTARKDRVTRTEVRSPVRGTVKQLHFNTVGGVVQPGQTFRDCADCPEMVVIRAGSFMMGSLVNEPGRDSDESPRHRVTIPNAFALGKYEVTFAEWDACVQAGGCSHRPYDNGWGRGK